MDTKYHINLVLNPSTSYHRTKNDADLVKQAQELYPAAEKAMLDYLQTGDADRYVQGIRDYDRFVWLASHQGDKSNIFAYKKIKVSPTWTEQMWAPVFERVRQAMQAHWSAELVLIQNMEVVESLTARGPSGYKDVDGGIGVVKKFEGYRKPAVMPIVVSEKKTGHFCKTACTGVDGIVRRVRMMNPAVLALAITDNNVSVGRKVDVINSFGAGGVLIQQRGLGNNGDKTLAYPELDADKFALVERLCVNYLKSLDLDCFTDVRPGENSGVSLRGEIDSKGYYLPMALEKFAK